MQPETTYWVIEEHAVWGRPNFYMLIESGQTRWTRDVTEATRFASYGSAMNAILDHTDPADRNCAPVEHMDVAFSRATDSPATPKTVSNEARYLGTLLAVIHRDGGQHQGRVGTAQAVEDAHQIWARQQSRLDDALAEIEKLREVINPVIARLAEAEQVRMMTKVNDATVSINLGTLRALRTPRLRHRVPRQTGGERCRRVVSR